MKCTLVGYRDVDFQPENSKDRIVGVSLYVTYPDDNVKGIVAEKLFIGQRVLNSYTPTVGDELSIDFNRYGKVDTVNVEY